MRPILRIPEPVTSLRMKPIQTPFRAGAACRFRMAHDKVLAPAACQRHDPTQGRSAMDTPLTA
jgi:hypothetical protein